MTAENTHATAPQKESPKARPNGTPRVVSDPNEVARLALVQIDAINAKKDELTLAIKGLSDLTRQLVRAYGEQTRVIQALGARVKELEAHTAKEQGPLPGA